jgi:hypothetical protein
MEYLIGAVVAVILMIATNRFVSNHVKQQSFPIKYYQSSSFELIKHIIQKASVAEDSPVTQSSKHFDKISTKILFVDEQAFWIKDNTLFMADVVEGEIDNDTTTEVDTMNMNKVQLEKTIFIVEKLREGMNNDSGNPG